MRRRRVGLIGVPTSAGAHWPGQEKAPGVLRGAGLVELLESAGCAVVDHGDLPRFRFRPDGGHPQNLAAVIEVARSVAERVEGALGDGEIPLVIGGDCTIELGCSAGSCALTRTLRCCISTGAWICGPPPTTPQAFSTPWGWRT